MASPRKKPRFSRTRKRRKPADPLAGCAAEFKALRQLIGRNLQGWRERRGFTLQQLSRRSGVSPNTIDRIERGWRDDCTINIHAKIAHGLGIQLHQLAKDDKPIYERIWKKTKRQAALRSKP